MLTYRGFGPLCWGLSSHSWQHELNPQHEDLKPPYVYVSILTIDSGHTLTENGSASIKKIFVTYCCHLAHICKQLLSTTVSLWNWTCQCWYLFYPIIVLDNVSRFMYWHDWIWSYTNNTYKYMCSHKKDFYSTPSFPLLLPLDPSSVSLPPPAPTL